MREPIRLHAAGARMIAHRGLSGIERENTCAAFVAAGNRSYYGIETDIHRTADGQYIVVHDDDARRVAGVDLRTARTQARANIGYVAQKFSLYDKLTVYENIHFFGGI